MKKISVFVSLILLMSILFACDSAITAEQLVGKWYLQSIDSEINGEKSSGPILTSSDDVYYEFNPDSTYVLVELGEEEHGTWMLSADSLLGISPVDYKDDSVNYLWMKIKSLDDSVLTISNTINTDYGIVDEISVYRRCR